MKFTTAFGIKEKNLEFLDINLYGDFPFFIDPLLLKYSKELSGSYDKFLNYFSREDIISFKFKEIKETHLGFGYLNYSGRGIGIKTANKIRNNIILNKYNYDLDTIGIFEKGIGKDMISDMTTNIILKDLLCFTEKMCKKYGVKTQVFGVEVEPYVIEKFNLPVHENNYIILVPKEVLRKDELLIARNSFVNNIFTVVPSIDNNESRERLNSVIYKSVYSKKKQKNEKKKKSKKDISKNIEEMIEIEPNIIRKYKEYIELQNPETNVTEQDIDSQNILINNVENLEKNLLKIFECSVERQVSLEENVRDLILYYKNEIESSDLIKVFKSSKSEATHQRIFRSIGNRENIGLNSEVNNGNGPVDFKCNNNNEECLIEFKLTSSTKAKNVYAQVEGYLERNLKVSKSFVVLISYTEEEYNRAQEIKNGNQNQSIETIIINCDETKYVSASNRK